MKTIVTREELREELSQECAIIGRNYVFKDGCEPESHQRFRNARDRARCLLDLLVKYCNEMEPDVEGIALEEINKALFSYHGNLNTGACKYQILSWHVLEDESFEKKKETTKLYLYEYCDAHKTRDSASTCIADTQAPAILKAIIDDIYGDVVYFDGYKDARDELEALISVLGITDLSQISSVEFSTDMIYRLNTGLEYAFLREVESGERQE